MEPSVYIQWVQKYLGALVLQQVARVNDVANNPLPYLFLQMLRKEFSVTGKWESLSMNNSLVAADVVALDSPLPLKKRGSLGRASGDIAKIGMEFQLNETQLQELDTLVAIGGTEAQIVRFLFQDLPNAVQGVYERLEAMFLEGLSTGVTVVRDTENVGTGVRLDYGYRAENKFTATTAFSDVDSNPFDQIQETILEKAEADGNIITRIFTDRATLQAIAKSTQARQEFAFLSGFVGSQIPVLSTAQLNEVAERRYGFQFVEVNRSVRIQRNGVNTTVKPWAAGAMVGVTTDQIGSYVWARLAEMTRPVEGVTYTTADDFILLSQFRQNRPSLAEFLTSQARVVPVISGVDAIYLLDSNSDEIPVG